MRKKTGFVLVLPADYETPLHVEQLELDDEGSLQLEAMQELVGGYIERVRTQSLILRGSAWVNEEGLLRGLPGNRRLSALLLQPIVGDGFVELDDRDNRQMLREVGMGAILDQLGFDDSLTTKSIPV